MKVILKEDVKKLGKKGDVVNVADGHARNLLFPKGLAEPFTESSKKRLETEKQGQKDKADRLLKKAQDEAKELGEKKIVVKAKSGESGKLFGSVTSPDIASAIKKDTGYEIDKRDILIDEPIRHTGFHEVKIKLHKNVTATVKVEVVEE
jgi:large subunit ribosomal protein L9